MTVGPFSTTGWRHPSPVPSRATAFALAAGLAAGPTPARRAALAVLKAMAQSAPAVPALAGAVLVASRAILRDVPGEGSSTADVLADLRRLRVGDLLDEATPAGSLLDCFRSAPLFDIAGVDLDTAAPTGGSNGWLVRAGQWTDWCLVEEDRSLLCRLGHACLAGDNEVIGRIAVALGREIFGDVVRAGPTAFPVERLLAVTEGAGPYTGGGPCPRALAMEGVRALARGRVIGGVVYPGPRGNELFIGSLLPHYPVNGR